MLRTETMHGFKVLKCVGLFSLLLLSKNLHFFHEWINLYLGKGLCQFSVVLFMDKEKCACPSDRSCQRFTRPNQISTCPEQSDRGFVAPCGNGGSELGTFNLWPRSVLTLPKRNTSLSTFTLITGCTELLLLSDHASERGGKSHRCWG